MLQVLVFISIFFFSGIICWEQYRIWVVVHLGGYFGNLVPVPVVGSPSFLSLLDHFRILHLHLLQEQQEQTTVRFCMSFQLARLLLSEDFVLVPSQTQMQLPLLHQHRLLLSLLYMWVLFSVSCFLYIWWVQLGFLNWIELVGYNIVTLRYVGNAEVA